MSEALKEYTTEKSGERNSLSLKQRLVVWSAAMLLLAAAGLKAWPLITGQVVESQIASLGKLILIQGEILLAIWLVSEIASAWAFRAAIIFFAAAAVVNLRSTWLGEASCGCFGKLTIDPAYSLAVNLGLVGGLSFAKDLSIHRTPFLAFVVLGSLVLAIFLPSAIARDLHSLDRSSNHRLLRPIDWLGKRVPYEREFGLDLPDGKMWLLDTNCDVCRKKLTDLALSIKEGRMVPVTDPNGILLINNDGNRHQGDIDYRLLKSRQINIYSPANKNIAWIIASPTSITLQNGIVVDVTRL